MPYPHIYIIHLRRTPERKLYIQRQLDTLNLKYSFIDAIDKYDLCSKQYRSDVARQLGMDERQMEYKYRLFQDKGFPVLLSHLKAYNAIIKDKIPVACILEDDSRIFPEFLNVLNAAQKVPWDILKLSSYGRTPRKIMLSLFYNYNSPIRMKIFQALGVAVATCFKKYRGITRFYVAYRMVLDIIRCHFDIIGNHLYFNHGFGKILKRYTKRRRIRMSEPGVRFWLPRYYAAEIGSPPSADKSSWYKITAKSRIVEPGEPTISGTAYMLRLPTAVMMKQMVSDVNLPIQHIDAFPWILHKYNDVKFSICYPPCVGFALQYLVNSARYQYLGE